jgi:hypothetical protein
MQMDIWELFFWMMYAVVMVMVIIFIVRPILRFLNLRDPRYVKYSIVDTGESGFVDFRKKTDANVKGSKRIFDLNCIIGKTLFYQHANAQPLTVECDKTKMKWFCDQAEFKTVLEQNVIEKLMLSLEGKKLGIIVILALIACVVPIVIYYLISGNIADSQKIILAAINASRDVVPHIGGQIIQVK